MVHSEVDLGLPLWRSLWNSLPAALRRPEMMLHTFKQQLKAYLFHIWCANEQREHPPPPGSVVAFFGDSGAGYKTADLLTYLFYSSHFRDIFSPSSLSHERVFYWLIFYRVLIQAIQASLFPHNMPIVTYLSTLCFSTVFSCHLVLDIKPYYSLLTVLACHLVHVTPFICFTTFRVRLANNRWYEMKQVSKSTVWCVHQWTGYIGILLWWHLINMKWNK